MTRRAELFVDARYELGEGPIWNHFNQRLYWFDILDRSLYSADTSGRIVEHFRFDDTAAAAAIIDENRLAVALAHELVSLDLRSGERARLVEIEPAKPGNRTNDSRVNRAGGFWIGTMSRQGDAVSGEGAVYQYRQGAMSLVTDKVTIPNSICFSPDGTLAYFTDTGTRQILKRPLDRETGLPIGNWSVFATVENGYPDGSIVDSEGFLWNARWGGHCVVRHAPDGREVEVIEVPAGQVSCPALGGPDLKTLYITTAWEAVDAAGRAADPLLGAVFAIDVDVPGLPETLLAL